MTDVKHTPEAEAIADAILKAAGSALKYHTMPKGREAIFAAAQKGLDGAQNDLLDCLLDIKRLAGKSGDEEADPFALLDLIHERVLASLTKANGGQQ